MLLALFLAVQTAAAAPICADQVTPAASAEQCPRFIFFDSGGVEIRSEWNEVVAAAAADARAGKRLLLQGYSDRSGSAAANLEIARRRSTAVRDALVAAGAGADRIEIRVHGEDQPLVATADGVREVQNRRVAITIAP